MLGLDLAIKTGSIAKLEVDPDLNLVTSAKVLFSWTRGPRSKDSLVNIIGFFQENVYPHINKKNGSAIGIDWNLTEIFWGSNRKLGNIKTFVAGHIFNECRHKGITCVFVSPAQVRKFFNYNNQVPKFDVQRKFLTLPTISESPHRFLDGGKMTEHDVDALILAYILGCKIK